MAKKVMPDRIKQAVAGSQSILPNINIGSNSISAFSENQSSEYYVTGTPSANGETDIKFNKTETASKSHYLIILIAVGGALWFLNKKAGEI